MKTTTFKQGFKTLLVLLTGLLAMSGWGQTYSHTINEKTWETNGNSVLSGVTWNLATTGAAASSNFYDSTKGQQFGSSANPFTSAVISTNGIPGTISIIKLSSSVANGGDAKITSVVVGGTTFTPTNQSLTTSNTQYTFTGTGSGEIVITWTNTQRAFYLKKIEVDYQEVAIPEFTVTFAPNGGLGTITPQAASAATDLTLNTFTRTGYVFGGWNTAANGSGTAYTDGQQYDFSADLTLYAQWKPIITYDANGGINPPPAAVTALDGSHTIQSSGGMSRDNYDFVHWNTQADGNGTTYTPGATATFTTPTTLYAQWLLCAATIQSISPASGAPVGTEITIIVTADYFNEGAQYDLLFNDSTTPVLATATSDTTIKVTVPTDAKSGTLSISTEQGCPTLTTYTIITNDISGCE